MEPSREASLTEWKEMLGANNTRESTNKYLAWARRFEEWREGRPDGREALAEFDALLRDPDVLKRQKEGTASADAWSSARIPDGGYAYSMRVIAVSAAKSWVDHQYGVDFGNHQANQVQNICRGEPAEFRPEAATQEEVRRILEDTRHCEADACHAMTMTGYDAIMRGIEVCRVRFDDLDLDRGTLYVRAAKGSQSRDVRLHDSTLGMLADYREMVLDRFDDPEYLFYAFFNHYWNKPWHPGFHSFARHTAVTRRLENGEPLDSVNQRARHSTIKMTARYNRVTGGASEPLPELQ